MPFLLDLPVWRCLANAAGPQVSRKVYVGRVDYLVYVQGSVACVEPVSVFHLYTAVTMFRVNEVEVGSGLVNWE